MVCEDSVCVCVGVGGGGEGGRGGRVRDSTINRNV